MALGRARQQRTAVPDAAGHHRGHPRGTTWPPGADIVETNTFNANAISMADYGMETSGPGAELRRPSLWPAAPPMPPPRRTGRALSPGPSARPTSSCPSPSVSNPAFREMTFDQFVHVYREQVAALVEAGVDLLLVETIFDTQVAKAAFFAIQQYFDEGGRRRAASCAASPIAATRPAALCPDRRLKAFGIRSRLRASAQRRAELRVRPETS